MGSEMCIRDRVCGFDRASRSDTQLPIQDSNTTFRTTAKAHQNHLTTPPHVPVSPIPKGQAIEARGLSGVSYRSEDRAVASDLDRLTLRYRPHWGVARHGEAVLARLIGEPEAGITDLRREAHRKP